MPGTGVYPGGNFIPFISAQSPAFVVGAPFRGVLHTTESTDYEPSTTTYYGHNNPPHFTVERRTGGAQVYQHFSINNGSRALANEAGGVETNRQSAIQIEIAWKSNKIKDLPTDFKDDLRLLMRWIEAQTGIQRTAPPFFGSEAYGSGSISRMSHAKWNAYNAWCGHQHVPENIHWDPGPIDINYLL